MTVLPTPWLVMVVTLAIGGCGRKEGAPLPSPPPVTPEPARPAPAPEPSPTDAAAQPDAAVTKAEPPVPIKGGHRAAEVADAGGSGRGAIAKLSVTGSVARGEVERVLRAAVPKLQACRASNGAGKGTLALEVTFDDRGWVSLAEVKRSTVTGGDPQMCVVELLRALRFPKPSDGKDATASFSLQFR